MTNVLEEKVRAMLNGERKRREIALKWIGEVEEILVKVAQDIWGSEGEPVVRLTRIRNNQKDYTCIYYDYGNHHSFGFHNDEHANAFMGVFISELHGRDFWYAIQVIMEWIPQVCDAIDKRNTARNELLSKINA